MLKQSQAAFTIVFFFIISYPMTSNSVDERYRLSLGGSSNSYNSSIQVNDADGDQGSRLDFEDDLGYDSNLSIGYAKLEYRINPNHKIAITFSPFERDSSVSIDDDISYQGDTILAGATVTSKSTNQIFDIEYAYLISADHRQQLDLIAGIYWIQSEFELSAVGTINFGTGNQSFSNDYNRKNSTDIPVPLFGMAYRYNFDRNWRFNGSIRYFQSSFDNVDSEIAAAFSAIEYRPSDKWGVGGALYYFDTDIDLTKTRFHGSVNWQYSGINAFVFLDF